MKPCLDMHAKRSPSRVKMLMACISCACVVATGRSTATTPPSAGAEVPELAMFDTIMQGFMDTHDISAGTLAIMRNGRIVFDRVYGWRDADRTQRLQPQAMMRVASLTKPFTAAAIRKLVADGALALDSRVFDLGDGNGGLLAVQPFGEPDVRLGDITINHCLQHRGGWDRGIAGDHTYRELQVAADMGVPSPPGRTNMVRWIMGQPLQHAPGSTYAYSNIGYLVLGLVVEHVSGMQALDFHRQHVLAAAGIDASEVEMGHTFAIAHSAREPYYETPELLVANVFFPATSPDPFVPAPYGGWEHEARTGRPHRHDREVAGPVRPALSVFGNQIGGPRPTVGHWNYSHTGSLVGTSSLMQQRSDGINVGLILNRHSASISFSTALREQIDFALDNGAVVAWPPADRLFASAFDTH